MSVHLFIVFKQQVSQYQDHLSGEDSKTKLLDYGYSYVPHFNFYQYNYAHFRNIIHAHYLGVLRQLLIYAYSTFPNTYGYSLSIYVWYAAG